MRDDVELSLYKKPRRDFHPRRMTLLPSLRHIPTLLAVLCALSGRAGAESDLAPVDVLISVPDQKMLVVREGGWVRKYKISTSRFGIGDNFGSYKTPVGRLRVWEKLGGDLPSGAVIKHREATGEILPANAPGRDPIVSRILWLEGLESQNDNARGRGIYIHGTTEEVNIGKAVSWGCIRMRSEDVIELYEIVPVGATVTISEEGSPHFPKWKPAPPVIIASQPVLAPSTARKFAQQPRLTAEATPKLRRILSERLPAVGELLRPGDERAVPADAAVANAFHGSILFAGLPTVTKPAAKVPVPPERPAISEAFTLAAPPPAPDGVSMRLVMPDLPMRLIDIRRATVTPLLASVSMFTAPPPDATLAGSPRVGMRPSLR